MSEYSPIRISSLKGNLSIPFDVYVKVGERYILYCRAKEAIEGSRLDRLRSKKAKYVYIENSQIKAYVDFINDRVKAAYDPATDISLDRRTGLILGAIQTSAEELMDRLEDPVKYSINMDNAARLMKFMQREPEALKSFLSHGNAEHNIAHHGVHVAALAYELANYMGQVKDKPMQIPVMMTGCLIHDLEHNYNNLNVTIPEEQMSSAERMIYCTHGANGLKRIQEYEFYDPLIRDIVLAHDTHAVKGMTEDEKIKKIANPLVQIAATANIYDYYVNKHQLDPKAALKKMLIEEVGDLPLDCLKGLQQVLKNKGIV